MLEKTEAPKISKFLEIFQITEKVHLDSQKSAAGLVSGAALGATAERKVWKSRNAKESRKSGNC